MRGHTLFEACTEVAEGCRAPYVRLVSDRILGFFRQENLDQSEENNLS